MITSPAQLDAAFYEMVHRLRFQPAESGSERRTKDRFTYRCVQLIAPYDGQNLPRRTDFTPLPLNDLSSGGFSFYAPRKIPTSQVVVALGTGPYKLFKAEIRHCTEAIFEGESQFIMGCRLLERIDQPSDWGM